MRGDLNSLVPLAIGFEYPLTLAEVYKCLETGKPREHLFHPTRAAQNWKKMGNYVPVVTTVVEAMLAYGCHDEVVAVAQGIDTRETYLQVLGANLTEEISRYLPLLEKVESRDLKVVENFLECSLIIPDLEAAKLAAQKLGRELRSRELEGMLRHCLDLPSTGEVIEVCSMLERTLTKKEGNILIQRNIENGDPAELMIALSFIGRKLTTKELSLFENENK